MPPTKIGVLALQGSFKEHLAAISRFGAEVTGAEVRVPPDLVDCAALIIPGGESTSLMVGLEDSGLLELVRNFARNKPVWGVCAGVILLADRLEPPSSTQPMLGGLDVTVKRNAFGRQSDSKFRTIEVDESAPRGLARSSYFIRAPLITQAGSSASKLASVAEGIVAVRDGKKLATCFHPEISHDDSWLNFFLTDICKIELKATPKSMPAFEATGPWAVPTVDETEPGTATKRAFAIFQQGGVIMDVVNAEQARIAEAAGAVSVMALERIPADIKADGGVARSSDPRMIKEVLEAITIPCMAKARIGHFYEARVLEALNVDCVDESEVLTAADEAHHIDKRGFKIPFVCGAQDLGEALRRISEGASMIRLKGNAGTGNVMNAVRHARAVFSEIRKLKTMREDEIYTYAKEKRVSVELVEQVRLAGRLPVVTFAAGGLATPADVAMLMCLGVDGVFVGSGIFKGENPAARARAMVAACTHYQRPNIVAKVSEGLGKAMVGLLEHEDPVVVAKQRADAANATLMTENLGGFKRSKDPRDYYVAEEDSGEVPIPKKPAYPVGGIDPAIRA